MLAIRETKAAVQPPLAGEMSGRTEGALSRQPFGKRVIAADLAEPDTHRFASQVVMCSPRAVPAALLVDPAQEAHRGRIKVRCLVATKNVSRESETIAENLTKARSRTKGCAYAEV
jgi:hypothetical protein